MNIVLIGYRGTGKSAIGAILGDMLSRDVVSTDDEIVARTGCSIPEFVEANGWPAFRDIESQVCAEVGKRDGIVIDCGGGVVTRAQNVEALRANGLCFWLQAAVETIAERIGGDTNRPSLTGGKSFVDEIAQVLEERTPLYESAADEIIDTEQGTPRELAAAIAERFQTG